MNNTIVPTKISHPMPKNLETHETIGNYLRRMAFALEKIAGGSQTPTVEEPDLETETTILEFTPDKSDDYFGIVSTSGNHTLPENERKFSNSGWSIDEKGLYLSPANNNNRLLLLSHQLLATNLLNIKYYLHIPNSDFYVNLFTPIQPQTQSGLRYSLSLSKATLNDYTMGSVYTSIVRLQSINFFQYSYLCCEFNLLQKKLDIYESDFNYSEKNLLGTIPFPLSYTGFLIPGFAGLFNNSNNRLKKIEIEKYK